MGECPQPVFIKQEGQLMSFPCGVCIECKRKKANEWAGRLWIEKKRANKTLFITLTYNNESLPLTKEYIPT